MSSFLPVGGETPQYFSAVHSQALCKPNFVHIVADNVEEQRNDGRLCILCPTPTSTKPSQTVGVSSSNLNYTYHRQANGLVERVHKQLKADTVALKNILKIEIRAELGTRSFFPGLLSALRSFFNQGSLSL